MKEPSRVTVTGPLEPYALGFGDHLAEQGYAPASATAQVQLMAHLSRWMASEHLPAADLQLRRVEQFAHGRRAAGYRRYQSSAALNPLLNYLRALDVIPTQATESPETPGDELLARYHCYLVGERSLAEGTIRYYARIARLFLAEADSPDLSHLATREVSRFVLEECQGWSIAARSGACPGPNAQPPAGASRGSALRARRSCAHAEHPSGWSHTPTTLRSRPPRRDRARPWRVRAAGRHLDR